MDSKQLIKKILATDINKNKIQSLDAVHRQKDWNHLQRRQQQRAIDNTMIQITLLYGFKKFHKGATTYTLNDRSLKRTRYAKYIDILRGLKVVCEQD